MRPAKSKFDKKLLVSLSSCYAITRRNTLQHEENVSFQFLSLRQRLQTQHSLHCDRFEIATKGGHLREKLRTALSRMGFEILSPG